MKSRRYEEHVLSNMALRLQQIERMLDTIEDTKTFSIPIYNDYGEYDDFDPPQTAFDPLEDRAYFDGNQALATGFLYITSGTETEESAVPGGGHYVPEQLLISTFPRSDSPTDPFYDPLYADYINTHRCLMGQLCTSWASYVNGRCGLPAPE